MPYLSEMIGRRIVTENGLPAGRVADLVVSPSQKFPTVKGLAARQPRGGAERRSYIPWGRVVELTVDKVVVRSLEAGRRAEEAPDESDVFLYRDLLDKQIVDMDGYRIVRVTDIRIAKSGGQLQVIGADVGVLAILRRLGLTRLADRLKSDRGNVFRDRIVPWNLVSPTGPMPYDVRLRVPYREFLELHPSDLADIVEQLPEDQRFKVLALIEDPKAARVLARMLPAIRSEVAVSLEDERLSNLLEIMPPDEAADILGALPRGKAQFLLSLMGIDEASVVSELLGYDPATAGGRMTTEFIAVPSDLTAAGTIDYLRREAAAAETIYYVYVVDRDHHLSGVLSLRDLLRANPDSRVESLMMRDVITSEVDDDQEIVADALNRYNLLALPVVDDDHVLKGIVTVDDAIDVMMQESGEDFSQLSGVPFEEEGTPVRDAFDVRRQVATVLTFMGAVIATGMFAVFRSEFVAAPALVFFVPLALRASHDSSVWSLAAAVREIRERESEPRKVAELLGREYLFTLASALIVSALGFAACFLWVRRVAPALAGAIGLIAAIAVAGMLGLAAPIVLRRARPGPAVGPGRLVVALVMGASVVAFLAVSGALARAWG